MKKLPILQKNNFLNYSVLFISLLALNACFPKIDPRWSQIDKARPVTIQERTKACQLVQERTSEISSLRTLSEVTLNSDSGLQSLRLSLVFNSPTKIRFEILPPAQAVALYMATSSGAETLLIEPAKKEATKVKDSQDLVARFLKIRISPQDLAYILSARIPPRDLSRICSPSDGAEFFYSIDGPGITAFDSQSGQYWTISMQSGLLRTALLRRVTDEWPVISADFEEDDFADPRQLYPRKIELVLGNEILFTRIEPSIVKFNTVIPDTLFEMKIPGGYTVVEK